MPLGISFVGFRQFESVGKDGGPGNPEDPSNSFWKILNMGSISIQKHEMDMW